MLVYECDLSASFTKFNWNVPEHGEWLSNIPGKAVNGSQTDIKDGLHPSVTPSPRRLHTCVLSASSFYCVCFTSNVTFLEAEDLSCKLCKCERLLIFNRLHTRAKQ